MKNIIALLILVSIFGCAARDHLHPGVYTTPPEARGIAHGVYLSEWQTSKIEVEKIAKKAAEDAHDRAVYATRSIAVGLIDLDRPIYFEDGSSTITGPAHATLERKVQLMKQHPNVGLKIVGHASRTGKAKSNANLSKRRAAVVKQYMLAQGIQSNRIITSWRGFRHSSLDTDAHEFDRKVEFITFTIPTTK